MPQTLTIPFHAFKLHLPDGGPVIFPLSDANALHLKKSIGQLSEKYKDRFQKKLLDKGKYARILNELQHGKFGHKTFQVQFPAAKDGMSYPAFELEFDCFFQQSNEKFWGIIPALGLETMAEKEDELEERLQEVIKVDFTSKKRLSHVQHIISAIWFDAISIEKTEMELTFYSPTELVELQKEQKRQLLPKVADRLEIKNKVAYGREEELTHLERIVASNFSKNILLVGASGSGKTALVRELAHRRLEQKEPNYIWETTASVLIKELTIETGWQDNLSLLVNELTANNDILFVRNLAELFEVGQYEGNKVSMAEYIQPYVSRGELTLIAECTPEERARIEVRNPNYLSFFQSIQLEEPKEGLEDIIRQKVEDLAGAKQVVFETDAIDEVIRLHRRFSPYSGMPGKPIRFLESILLAKAPTAPKEKGSAKKQAERSETIDRVEVRRHSVLQHYCDESGLPMFMVDPALPMNVEAIKAQFNNQVFGQERAVNTVTSLLAAVKTALTRTGKPIASFLFVGPTGVGKTELAKVLAGFMFGSRDRLLRFDMSEFSDPWTVMRLTGQGYHADGLLTSAVRREPFCVLLFDEIEKADPSFFDLLLQIIGEGRLSDSQGKLVNFCSTIIIMTSNIGAARLQNSRIGWKKELDTEEVTSHFIREVEKNFKPELFNRIDSVVAFEPLSRETVRLVVGREIEKFKKREGIQFRRLEMEITDEVLGHLALAGYDARYGARYLQRVIREKLIVPMAYTLNQYDHDDQLVLKVGLENGQVTIQASSDPLAFEMLMEQWDKLTLADQTSFLRRKMMVMLEGALYMRIQSEIDMMEGEKKVDEKLFWNDLARSNLYTNLLNVAGRAEHLYNRIKQLEIEIALVAMDQGSFDTGFEGQIEEWETAYFNLMVEAFSLLFPENNNCYLSIYGTEPQAVSKFYLGLIERRGFEIKTVQAVWYREGFMGKDDDNPFQDGQSTEPGPFVKRVIEHLGIDKNALPPPAPGDRLYGVEFCIAGPASNLYFQGENGIQQWETIAKEPMNSYQVLVSNSHSPTPPNIVRQQYYQKPKPRRTVTSTEIKDTPLGIQTQVKPNARVEFIAEILDEVFKKEIEELVK